MKERVAVEGKGWGMAAREALELVVRGEEAPVAYACKDCGALFSARIEDARQLAADHCSRTCRCGGVLVGDLALCARCTLDERRDREDRLFGKAVQVQVEDYPDEPVYWEGQVGTMGTGFFLNIDELLDHCDEESLDWPKYVWACQAKPLQITAEAVLQAAEEEQSGTDDISAESIDELRQLLEAWASKQKYRSWVPDFGRAVLLRDPSPPGGL